MTKIDIISGFWVPAKTIPSSSVCWPMRAQGEQVVLIENEFECEIGIDGGFLKDAGIVVNEMNAGCICCSLVGDPARRCTMLWTSTIGPHLIEPSASASCRMLSLRYRTRPRGSAE